MNIIKFQRAGDSVDILFSDDDGPVTKVSVPLDKLISALPEDLLDEFWRPQLDDALAQVDNLRAGLAETSRDADRIAGQRDEAREEVARLRAEVEQLQVRSNHVTTQRDEVRRQLAEANTHAARLTNDRDEALAQVEQLRVHSNHVTTKRDEVRRQLADAVRQARGLNVRLTAERDEARDKWDRVSKTAADLASERDDLRQRVAIMENLQTSAIAEYDNQRRSIRALRRTIKELTS